MVTILFKYYFIFFKFIISKYFLVNSSDFKEGIEKLADLLNISKHPDHKITLEAIHKFIIKRLNEEAINNPSSILPKVPKIF